MGISSSPISIAVTNRCDFNCPFCYAPKKAAELGSKRLMGWLDELDTNGCLGVGLGGGEPTLYKDLPIICGHIKEKTGLAVTFTTNAHHLNRSLVNELIGNVNFIRVSMDGVGETYELLRGRATKREG